MYRKILVPLDGSRRAEKILGHAENLAIRYQAEVILLQIVRPPILVGGDMTDINRFQEEYEERKKKTKAYLKGILGEFSAKGIRGKVRVMGGPVVRTIIEVADTEEVDLIALSSHGRGGVSRVFYGSVAAGILQRVNRPLLLIRSRKVS